MTLFANPLFHHLKLWSFLPQLADTPVIAEAVDALVEGIPQDEDFGAFDELKERRDATGVVRLRR